MMHAQTTTMPPRVRQGTIALITGVLTFVFWTSALIGGLLVFIPALIWLPGLAPALLLLGVWIVLCVLIHQVLLRIQTFVQQYALDMLEWLATSRSMLKDEPVTPYSPASPRRENTADLLPVYEGLYPRL